MKENELRIGNWVLSPTEGDVQIENGWQIDEGEEVEPIPLTEEWLGRCGFYGRNDFKWTGKVGIQSVDGKYYFAFKDMGNVVFHSIVECKYVHQLQNLYFALTGEELTQ